MKETTLLVGSSIRKGVETKDRNGDATVRSFPGTTSQTLKSKLQEYETDNCKTIILHVGGNDGDNGADMDSFQDEYILLLEILASEDRRLIVSGLLPRGTADLESYNPCAMKMTLTSLPTAKTNKLSKIIYNPIALLQKKKWSQNNKMYIYDQRTSYIHICIILLLTRVWSVYFFYWKLFADLNLV